MIEIKDFRSNVSDNLFIFVETLGDLDYNEMVGKLPYIQQLCQYFRVKVSTIIRYIKKNNITLNELFSYTTYNSPYNTLVCKNGVSSRTYSKQAKDYITKSYDVYLTQNRYIHCAFKQIVYDLFKLKFPELNEGYFLHQVPKFNIAHFKLGDRMDSIKRFIDDNDNLPLSELKKILKNPEYVKSTKEQTIFKLYTLDNSDVVYYPIFEATDPYKQSIGIHLYELFNKSWKDFYYRKMYVSGKEIFVGDLIEEYKDTKSIIELKKYFNVE